MLNLTIRVWSERQSAPTMFPVPSECYSGTTTRLGLNLSKGGTFPRKLHSLRTEAVDGSSATTMRSGIVQIVDAA